MPPSPEVRQLVRHPETKLGGVAAGLAHYFGLDVSLVRLAFVVAIFFSGLGLVVYFLAWLVIPKADRWPPPGPAPAPLSNRELVIGLVAFIVFGLLFVGRGDVFGLAMPALLLAGGIWLLMQREGAHRRPADSAMLIGADQPQDTVLTGTEADSNYVVPPGGPSQHPQLISERGGAPTGRRRRRLRRTIVILFSLIVLVPLVAAGIVIALLATGQIDARPGFSATYQPDQRADVPFDIDHDLADIELDLTEIDPADFDGEARPIAIDIDLGEIEVIVPEGMTVEVDATVDLGEVNVFGDEEDGIDNNVSVGADDPDISLDLQVGFGKITVRRQ